ncbi:MAG: hypothetical protein AAGJ81_02265 [Verrucomicrobiota bacterium]
MVIRGQKKQAKRPLLPSMIVVVAIALPAALFLYLQTSEDELVEQAVPEPVAKSAEREVEPAPVVEVELPRVVEVVEEQIVPEEPVPQEVPPQEVKEPVVIADDRFKTYTLVSSGGRELEAQILDVVGESAFIRRFDRRIFEIGFDRFDAKTQALVENWRERYAHLVTDEQKAFLTTPPEERVAEQEVAAIDSADAQVDDGELEGDVTGPYLKTRIRGVEWELVDNMSDEFEGRRMDEDKWQLEPRANGWVWIGRPPGLFRAENVRVEDGKMKVTVGKLDEPVVVRGNEFLYEGAIVRSLNAGEVGWFYECKMKANATEMSSTFWLMTKGHPIKKLELDIQECVGVVSPEADPWAAGWDRIYHSNMIHRANKHNPEPVQHQGSIKLDRKNSSRYFVYGAWWKSEYEVDFFLDGEYVYTIQAPIEWDVPAYLTMAIETYDWNPVPEEESRVEEGSEEERTTSYEWVRTWKSIPN